MEHEKNNFSLQVKEMKNILMQFESVINEINDLHDSNNPYNFIENDNEISNAPDTYSGNTYDENISRNGTSWSDGNQKSINRIQPIQTNPSSIFEATYNRNDIGYSNLFSNKSNSSECVDAFICYDSVNWNNSTVLSESNTNSDSGNTFICDNIDHLNGHAILSDFNTNGNFGDASIHVDYGCSNGNVLGVQIPTTYGFDEKQLECVLEEASSKNIVNYFYYHRDIYDAGNIFDNRMDVNDASGTILTHENHPSHEEYDISSNVEGDELLEIGLTNGTTKIYTVDGNEPNLTVAPVATCSMAHLQNDDDLVAEIDFEPHKPTEIDRLDANEPNSTLKLAADRKYDHKNGFDDSSHLVVENDFIECETIDIKRNRGCDNSKMFVPTSDSGPKMYCCKYCKVRVQKLERHLRTVHKNAKDVKRYLVFPPRSAQRRKIILKIQKEGDFMWNNDKELNKGEYAVRRRPNKKHQRKPWDLIPCPACLGAYSKSYLTRHWNKECAKNPLIGERGLHQLGRAVDGRVHHEASQDLVDIFATFRQNENIRHIRFDWLVVCYGNELCLNHSPHYQQGYICGKLRAAGKVLRASMSISAEITDMSSLFHVKHCNTVVDAIRSMGKFDYNTKRFGSPGTASCTVTLINAIGEMLVVEYLKLDDPVKERDVERFLKVFKMEVKNKINKLVAVSRLDKKRQKKENIPTTADVNKLAKYLDTEREKCFAQLVHKYTYDDWLKLSHLTMLSILVYNRRRAGEMQNLLKADFERREIIADQCDMLLNEIPEAARRKIKSRLTVRNKLGKRLVPVLLKHNWDDCLELLVRLRKDVGIPENNEFLFALPTQLKRIRTANVSSLMRTFSLSCGAENPSSLRGTNLRKHMASFSSTKNLSDNDISNLADFMGHAEAVHRTYYRINPLTNQVGKMSFLLDSALGNDNPRDGGDDNGEDDGEDETEDESDEYESDGESEDRIPLNATRKTIKKKNVKKTTNKVNIKKKANVKPKRAPKSRKKNLATNKPKETKILTRRIRGEISIKKRKKK